MQQQKITCQLGKQGSKESNGINNIKEEINIDWDEKDNFYGSRIRNIRTQLPKAIVLVKRLDLKTIKNAGFKKIINPKETTLDNNNAQSSAAKVLKRPSNSKTEMNGTVKKRKIVVEKPEETRECPKCKKACKIQSYAWHVFYCGKERTLQCAHCPYKTKWKKCLIAHISRIHPEDGDALTSKTYNKPELKKYCQKCERAFEALSITKCEICFSGLLFQCSKCNKNFSSRPTAHSHWVKSCGVTGYYHCHSCDYKAVYRNRVVHHLKIGHKNSPTNAIIQWKSLFQNNESEKNSSYKCSKCAKHMTSAGKLRMHVKLCKEVENEGNFVSNYIADPNRCSNCGKNFEHIYLLNKHISACMRNKYAIRVTKDSDEIIEVVEDHPPVIVIATEEIYKGINQMAVKYCDKCMLESEIEQIWWQTERSTRNIQCDKCKTILVFRCRKCLKEFYRKKDISYHLKIVCYPEDEFKCTECSFKAVSVHRVREHYRAVHVTISSKCQKCGKKYKNPKYLNAHLRHCGLKPEFQCAHCPFKSKFKRSLPDHIFRMHMEPKVVDRSDSLKISMRRFSQTVAHLRAFCSKCKQEKRLFDRLKICGKCKTKLYYRCKTCKKKYDVDDGSACDHVKAYLEMIKFECKRCGRGSMSKSSYSMHKSRCGAKFPCRYCKYVSNVKGTTTKHEKSKHPDKA